MYKRIYIIGGPGSGKTTLSRRLSKKYSIKEYELDKVAWDDDTHIKRTDEEAKKLLKEIVNKKSWIVEDIGRDKFMEARDKADVIYYIKMSKVKSYYRVIKRWFKQKYGNEPYNDIPNFNQFKYYISTVNSYFKKEKHRLESLEPYKDKVVYIKSKQTRTL